MGKSREDLQQMLETVTKSKNIYFQPPSSLYMSYPAVVYMLEDIDNTFASNSVYIQTKTYNLTVIDKDPDSEMMVIISKLPKCRFDRLFKSENLNHFVFVINY